MKKFDFESTYQGSSDDHYMGRSPQGVTISPTAEPRISKLPQFSRMPEQLRSDIAKQVALLSPKVKKVVHCVLGPKGTNISQAAQLFSKNYGIQYKSHLHYCETPEAAVLAARRLTKNGTVALYWTCAVYVRENNIFFGNTDALTFFVQQPMDLDHMQLACRPELAHLCTADDVPPSWKILSHPSPAPLFNALPNKVQHADSNAAAAARCARGEAEACMTTESARIEHGLVQVHSFGCPEMIFFGGISQEGVNQLLESQR